MSVTSNEGSCGLDLVWIDFEGSLEKIISGFWMFHWHHLWNVVFFLVGMTIDDSGTHSFTGVAAPLVTPKSPRRSKILGSSLFGFFCFHLEQFPGPDGEQLTDQFVQLAQLLQKGLDEGCSPEDAVWRRGQPDHFLGMVKKWVDHITRNSLKFIIVFLRFSAYFRTKAHVLLGKWGTWIHGLFCCCIDPWQMGTSHTYPRWQFSAGRHGWIWSSKFRIWLNQNHGS